MKLRMPGKDYTDPGYYFCTIVVEGRRHLFGKVVAWPDDKQPAGAEHQIQDINSSLQKKEQNPCHEVNVSRSLSSPYLTAEFPYGHGNPYKGACIAYSPYGMQVARELQKVGTEGQYLGKIEVKGKAILPDHIHVLFYISERLPKPLGHVINGFEVGCRRIWKNLCGIKLKQTEPYVLYESCEEEVRTGKWVLPQGQNIWPVEQPDGKLRVFEKGYNDGVVDRRGQLDGYYEYMRQNAWRVFLKQQHPELFRKVWGKELLPGIKFSMIGNMFLLNRPRRIAVRISRFATDNNGNYLLPKRLKTEAEISESIQPYLNQARHNTVLVTPCISPAEQAVVEAAYKGNLPVIMLCPYGFSQGYHPSQKHYDACSKGMLLQLAPWPYDPQRKLTKDLCESLNEMARKFSE